MSVKSKLTNKICMITVVSVFLFSSLISTSSTVISDVSIDNNFRMNNYKNVKHDLSSPAELEVFLDTIIPEYLEDYSVAGATFSMVKDGSVFLEKGYGYADSVSTTPIVSNETIFRIGSISKLFTATAIMQLVEDGLLDLDVDVNNYLTAFKIPDTYDEPITLRHLLTHTAGFEIADIQSLHSSSQTVLPLEDLLAERIPDRVRPPGIICSYSNYGVALLGYIIQEVSEKAFEQYIADEIFIPLKMNSSTFLQPLPSNLISRLSSGHNENGYPGYFEYVSVYPAGAASATASDMSNFMLAFLNNGSYDGNRILEEESVEMMLSDQFLPNEHLCGMGLGFYQFDLCDERLVGHGGDTLFFHSRMILIPELDIGVFASFNSIGGSLARTLLFDEFIEEYLTKPEVNLEPVQGYKRRAKRFNGLYVSSRRVYSDKNLIKEMYFIKESFSVKAKNGHLIVSSINGLEFVEVEPNYFVESTGEYYLELAFFENDRGEIIHFTTSFIGPFYAYQKTNPIYYGPEITSGIVIGITVIMLISLSYWGIRWIIDHTKKKDKIPRIQRLPRWGILINFILALIIEIIATVRINNDILLVIETTKTLGGLLIFPFLFLVSVISLIVFAWFAWTGTRSLLKDPYWKLSGRIHYSILVILSIVMVGIFASWQFYII
ncbi:MAG: beta-lactamase family protein [Asgard group archaeon]|nr:beta-lactamase family protein [Asgard group archaeon]